MEFDNKILNETMLIFAKQRIDIKDRKYTVVRSQQYEEAARIRDEERQLMNNITQAILDGGCEKENLNYTEQELYKILNLVEMEDVDFSNAIAKLKTDEFERFSIMTNAEKYKSGEITVDELNNRVKKSIQSIRKDIINKIEKLAKDL